MKRTQWQLLNEFSESAIQKIVKKFSNESDERTIRSYIDNFEKYKNGIQKKDPFQYTSFMEFEQAVDAAKGKSEFKKRNLADKGKPKEFINKREESSEAIADDENVTIFKGDEEHKCVKYGKGYSFCISRPGGGNMFGNYRLQKASTFYFIFFKKVPKSDPRHIMVLDRTQDGWEWTFGDNNTKQIQGGFDEVVKNFPVLGNYENLFQNKPITPKEKDNLEKLEDFIYNPTLDKFISYDYEMKILAVKTGVMLPDDIFDSLDNSLRNEYINVGGNLTKYQVNKLKENEIERYRKVRKLTIPQLIESNKYKVSKLDKGLSELVDISNDFKKVKISDVHQGIHMMEYDDDGRLLVHQLSNRVSRYDYDNNGNMTKDFRYSIGRQDPYYWRVMKYDKDGRLLLSNNSEGFKEKYRYDKNGTLRVAFSSKTGGDFSNKVASFYNDRGEYLYTKDFIAGKYTNNEGDEIQRPDINKESLNNNMLTQKDLLSEGFWKALGKGIAKTADYVVPELTRPIRSTVDAVKDIGSSIKQGWTGENPPPSNKSTQSSSSQSQAPYQYRGKYYAPDYSKQAVKKGTDWEVPVYQVDADYNQISNMQNIAVVDQNGVVKNVR